MSSVLNAVIDTWRRRPLVFGSADCCQFVGECVLAQTGVDYRALFPAYANESEAHQLIASYGDLVGLVSHAFGDAVHPSRARVGDPVVFIDAGRQVAGICIGPHIAAPGPGGLAFALMSDAVAAWCIGPAPAAIDALDVRDAHL